MSTSILCMNTASQSPYKLSVSCRLPLYWLLAVLRLISYTFRCLAEVSKLLQLQISSPGPPERPDLIWHSGLWDIQIALRIGSRESDGDLHWSFSISKARQFQDARQRNLRHHVWGKFLNAIYIQVNWSGRMIRWSDRAVGSMSLLVLRLHLYSYLPMFVLNRLGSFSWL